MGRSLAGPYVRGHGGSYMIAVAKHDWNSTGLWCFDPEIRVELAFFITSVCAS